MSDTVTYPSRRCPRCGRQLSPDAPEGLCASCLLTAGAETLTGSNDATSTGGASTGDPSRPGAPRLVDGQVWGPYRIIRLLGRGGMGEVYEAEQLETGRRLALKVLRAALRGDEDRARFIREGQLAASISHAHTVYIFGSEEVGGAPAITMELLSGGTLKDRVSAGGPMPPSAAVSAVLDVIGGLDAAQAAGILHRDIKPSNCFVDADGAVKVGDFGLSISTLSRDVQQALATTGFEGTPQFAAPEQLRGEPLDVRADIYASGATLYYLLTGRPPLDAPDFRELVAKVAAEKPQSPRELRRDIPRGLAAVVLRCLAKAPAGRPQSYAELADLLRPYASGDDVPSPLGARFTAWIADSVIVSITIWLITVSALTVGMTLGSATVIGVAAWSWLVPVIYYFVLEGGWGATLGKRLMGLSVTSQTPSESDARWWLRIGLRTAVFLVPSLFFMGAWNGRPYLLLSQVLTILLFSTARRGNGWTGVHELLSRTRVVQRNVRAVASAAPKASPADLGPALSSLRRVGPYAVHTTVGETGAGRLFVGIDPILRRHVWIHEVPPGTPPVEAGRRDTSRPGRLYWLAGRRLATENWDAFEAPRGEPFLTAPPASDWRQVHGALSSLATELDASAHEDGDTRRSLAHVWRRSDGQLVLLDFPWPALVGPDATQPRRPIELLAAVSTRAWAPATEPAAALSGMTLLRRLASGAPPALADVKAELLRLASTPSRPSRIRRALPMALAAMPIAALVLIVSVMLPMFARSLQGDAGNMFRQRSDFMRWMTWLTDSSADAELKTREQREAAEQYVAAHFGSLLTNDEFWTTQAPQIEPFLGWRRRAAEIAARHPAVSPDELARATAIVAPQIQELAAGSASLGANIPAGGEALRGFFGSGFASIPLLVSILCGLVSVLAVPGGLVTRALRHAVVRRDGREIGRARSAIRFLIGWSPVLVWIGCVGVPMFGEPRVSPGMAFAVGGLAFLLMAAGVAWTIASPGRGPHDRIAGTWVVPR
ncbi:MAG TPA: protein kinase [Vicinamibacterales bacterium]|nr:protein kinase [Vicinamibacterales bacterium]